MSPTRNVYLGPPTDDPAEALRICREVIAATCSDVPLRAVDVAAADASRRPKRVAAVYVELDTTEEKLRGSLRTLGRSFYWMNTAGLRVRLTAALSNNLPEFE